MPRQTGHLDALARPLGVPHHATLAGTTGAACLDDALHHCTHRMELVVARDLLDTAVLLEQDEVLQVLQEEVLAKQTTDHGFKLLEFPERVQRHPVDGSPSVKALLISGQRPQACQEEVGDRQHLVEHEEVRDVFLVGLELVKGVPDVGVGISGVLQLQDRQGHPVDEHHHIRAAGQLWTLDGVLVDDQPLVGIGVLEVDELHPIAQGLPVSLHLYRHSVRQPSVELPVRLHETGSVAVDYLAGSILQDGIWDGGIDAPQCTQEAILEHDLLVGCPLLVRPGWGDVRTEKTQIAQFLEPVETGLLCHVLVDECHAGNSTISGTWSFPENRSGRIASRILIRVWISSSRDLIDINKGSHILLNPSTTS